jgi:hypothetical protein
MSPITCYNRLFRWKSLVSLAHIFLPHQYDSISRAHKCMHLTYIVLSWWTDGHCTTRKSLPKILRWFVCRYLCRHLHKEFCPDFCTIQMIWLALYVSLWGASLFPMGASIVWWLQNGDTSNLVSTLGCATTRRKKPTRKMGEVLPYDRFIFYKIFFQLVVLEFSITLDHA